MGLLLGLITRRDEIARAIGVWSGCANGRNSVEVCTEVAAGLRFRHVRVDEDAVSDQPDYSLRDELERYGENKESAFVASLNVD